MTILHKVQLFLKSIGFSRFMYDPHNGAELFTALAIWTTLFAGLAMLYITLNRMATPKHVKLDPEHKWGVVYWACVWYLIYAAVALAVFFILPRLSPAVAAFLTMK